ncbi:MAG: hypothetical protein EP332_09175 [Bacteroidetes bacterium]|nr:MAG: hypothetical protein EP332_09175 [Bacteroidota bacterium]
MQKKSNPYIDYLYWALIVCLSILIRLPELLDPQILDGDEALMGLMAKHQWEGKDVSKFFWGQRYGFTYLETSAITLFYSIFGYGQFAVQSSMLLLWCLIMIGFYQLVKSYCGNPHLAFLLSLSFTALPAWYFWSIKARGGYLTSLLASTWLLYWMKRYHERWASWLALGLLLPFIYYSQLLWIPGTVIVLLAGNWYKQVSLKKLLMAIGGFASSYWVLHYYSMQEIDFWNPRPISFDYIAQNISLFPERLLYHLGGNYFLGSSYTYHTLTYWSTLFFVALLLVALSNAYLRWRNHKKIDWQSLLLLGASLSSWGFIFLSTNDYHPRYVLPFSGFLFIWFAYQLNHYSIKMNWRHWSLGIVSFLFFMGASVLIKGEGRYRDRKNEIPAMEAAVAQLEKEGIHYVLSPFPEFHWQLMFYSGEKVISRYHYKVDRFLPYAYVVEAVFQKRKTFPLVMHSTFPFSKTKSKLEPLGGFWYMPEADSMAFVELEFEGLYDERPPLNPRYWVK